MAETGWTKGPWRVEQDTYLIWGDCETDETGGVIRMGIPIIMGDEMRRSWGRPISHEEMAANVQLAAAAPDMAEALEELLGDFHAHPNDFGPDWHRAAAALARARGQEQERK